MNVFEQYQFDKKQKAHSVPVERPGAKKTMKGVSRQAKFLLENPDMLPFAHFQKIGMTIRDGDLLTTYFPNIFSVYEERYYVKRADLSAFNKAQEDYLKNPQKYDRPLTGYLTP